MKKIVKVEKIRSYQTLVYKNGKKSYQKKVYEEYQKEIIYQLIGLPKINDLRDLEVSIHFKCENKTVGDLDNITKPILDILQRNGYIVNDKQITELNLKKSFGHKENTIEMEIEEV
ncbi:MAG: RusA family crossover junction endodeoxyribonuclease [Bacilli bacterium]|nr:RusA family crossover junction endodeoxyribonuclease [Bacilli bacterium]